ncbi:thiol-disulfide oxidoreductase ResA-like [Schistocerca gregaria]|uniref:thiol-disulfide oxidoreductase ResA-like n=1 Tax=Schistocerca gregaria TaxID=7010 RepID=UPI00211E60D8|nr:thiol-disulfide oxidoreductase ResA-like [Schistocerca gregaria]
MSVDAFPLSDLIYIKGSPVDLESLKGKKIVVLELWATWCPPCQVASQFPDVVFIGVTSEEDVEHVKSFVEQMGEKMAYTVAIDNTNRVTQQYMNEFKLSGIPCAFVIDYDGKVCWNGHPLEDGMVETIKRIRR